jgi:hypothetical protein
MFLKYHRKQPNSRMPIAVKIYLAVLLIIKKIRAKNSKKRPLAIVNN